MAGILIPRREVWTRQPQYVVKLNPIVSDAVFTYLPSIGANVLLDGRILTNYDNVRLAQSIGSGGIYVAPGIDRAYISPTIPDNSITDATLIVIQRLPSLVGSNGWHSIQSDTVTTHVPYGGQIYLSTFSSSRWLSAANPPSGYDKLHAMIVRAKGSERKAWMVDRLIGSGTSDTNVRWTNWMVGNPSGAYPCIAETYALVLIPRALSEGQVNKILQNPWQLFAPRESSIFIPTGTGGNVYTISSNGSITLLGSITQIHERSLTPSGSIALASTNLITFTNGSITYTIIPSGSISLNGTNETNRYHLLVPQGNVALSGTMLARRTRGILPMGSIDFNGSATTAEVKVFKPSGDVVFSGTAQLYVPGMKIESTKLPMTGVGT